MDILNKIEQSTQAAKETVIELEKYQSGEISYDTFMLNAIKLNMKTEGFILEFFIDFLENNRTNNLPNSSSGSLHTAILDIDNIATALQIDEMEHSDELYNHIHNRMVNA